MILSQMKVVSSLIIRLSVPLLDLASSHNVAVWEIPLCLGNTRIDYALRSCACIPLWLVDKVSVVFRFNVIVVWISSFVRFVPASKSLLKK